MTSIHQVTLEVSDAHSATDFYTNALGLGHEIQVRTSTAETSGFRGFILGLDVAGPSSVDKLFAAAAGAGATTIMAPTNQDWGGYASVLQAADGTIWKISTAATDDNASGEIERIVLLLGVDDVTASKQFYVDQGLVIAKDFGDKYVEFEPGSGTVTLALYERGNLARDFGVSPEGSGARRLAIAGDNEPFVDLDGFGWENVTINSSTADVKALLDTRVEACTTKEIDRLMALYSSDIVYYDAVPPIQFVGSDDVRTNFLRFFDGYDGPIDLETQDQTVAIGDEVAFAHMIYQVSGERENGIEGTMEVRSTVCCRRSDDKWLITHEHVSVPVSPGTSWSAEGASTST